MGVKNCPEKRYVIVERPPWYSLCIGPTLALAFELQKKNLPRSLVKIQYCGEPPWPRGSVLSLRPPGLAFRILCLEGSVISFISSFSGGSPGPVKPIDIWLKPHSFHFILLQGRYIFSI